MNLLTQWLPNFSSYLPGSLFQSRQQQVFNQVAMQFLYHVQDDNIVFVRRLMQLGMNPNMQYDAYKGATPLHIACMARQLGMCRLLLEFGANSQARDNNGVTPLMHAAASGSLPLVRTLLDADPQDTSALDVHDNKGKSVLQYALQDGYRDDAMSARSARAVAEIVALLLARGAGESACHSLLESWTSEVDDLAELTASALEVSRQLADRSSAGYRAARDSVVQRCLIIKAIEGRVDLLASVLEQMPSAADGLGFFVDANLDDIELPVNAMSCFCSSKDGTSFLSPAVATVMAADSAFSAEPLRRLRSLGAPLDARDKLGFTPAFWAAALGRKEAFAFLLSKDGGRACATVKSHAGATLADVCAMRCLDDAASAAVLRVIGQHGGPLDRPDKQGKPPAQHLWDRGHLQALRFLVGHRGCAPHRPQLRCPTSGATGFTLLGCAIWHGWEAEVLSRLAQSQQLPQTLPGLPRQHKQQQQQLTYPQQLLLWAVEAGKWRILEPLFIHLGRFAASSSSPAAAWYARHQQLMPRLVSAAAAAGTGKSDRRLLVVLTDRLGADIDAVDRRDGETALTRATMAARLDTVEMLLSLGANSEGRRNARGLSASDVAVGSGCSDADFERLLDLFLDAGLPPWPAGAEQSTAQKDATAPKHSLSISERGVSIGCCGLTYQVLECNVTFSQPINLFRRCRRSNFPLLADILKRLRASLPGERRISLRAFTSLPAAATASDRAAQPGRTELLQLQRQATTTSAVWPHQELVAGLSDAKLRELLCQLHHLAAGGRYAQLPLDRLWLCVTAY